MTQNIFISYSRRETGFVDDLVGQLEKKKYDVWLDYRNLVPGTPWQDQIYQGIHDSDVILLVVSQASLASQNVEVEWRRVLKLNKRIILLIFEAVDLPPELETYEWVDFRGSYQAGLKELFSQLQSPIKEEHPVPQTGFKMPGTAWFAMIFSVSLAALSLSVFWTLFIPWLLLLLPYRIFKRNFNYVQTQAALWLLPFALFMSATTVSDQAKVSQLTEAVLISVPICISMGLILRSRSMQRWGKEQALRPTFASSFNPDNPQPRSVSFYVDHAPADKKIADELIRVNTKYGHTQVDKMEGAETVLVLLSRFKNDTDADPEHQVVFPIIVQTTDVSEKLSRIQRVDMRPGVRKLDAIAQLLPDPAKLLRVLGDRPRGKQTVLPGPIAAMFYFLLAMGVFVLGSFLKVFVGSFFAGSTQAYAFGYALVPYLGNLTLTGILLYFMVRSLLYRRGWLASLFKFSFGLILLGALLFWQLFLGAGMVETILSLQADADVISVNVVYLPVFIFLVSMIIMGVLFPFMLRDIRLWFPAKHKTK